MICYLKTNSIRNFKQNRLWELRVIVKFIGPEYVDIIFMPTLLKVGYRTIYMLTKIIRLNTDFKNY
jgi:hypothetical protein